MGQQLHRPSQLSLFLSVPSVTHAAHPVRVCTESCSCAEQREKFDAHEHDIGVSFDDGGGDGGGKALVRRMLLLTSI